MRRVLALTLCALALVSCERKAETAKPAAPTEVDRIIAMAGRLRGPGAEAARSELARSEYEATMPLVKRSGLEAALGGPERADAAIQALMAANERRYSANAVAIPRLIKIADDKDLNGFLGLVDSLGIGSAVATAINGVSVPEGAVPLNSKGMTGSISWSQGRANIEAVTQTSTDSLQSKTTTTITMDRCPDANGRVTVEFNSTSALTKPGSASGSNTVVRGTIVADVGDDAELPPHRDINMHVEQAAFQSGQGAFVDIDFAYTNRPGKPSMLFTNRTSSQATAADIEGAHALAVVGSIGAEQALRSAYDYWAHGGCVKLEPVVTPGGTRGVKPSTSFSILAAPRSRIDGGPVGGTVRADLSGGGSLSPAGVKRPADAQFTYVAPAEQNKTGAVKLEARSRRGVATADLSFDTNLRAYLADGGRGAFHGTGVICSFAKPFVISGSGATVTFTPTSDKGGTYSYTGNIAGFAVWGQGTWQVALTENGGVLKGYGPGSVRTPMGVRTASDGESYTLTPTAPCP